MDKIQDKSAEEVLKSKISVTNWNFLVTVLHSGEVYKQILNAMEEYKNQSSKDKRDELISELQERSEIAEDELDKLKQSDKQVISDEELIKWAKPIENGLKVMHTFLWLSTEIANKVQSLPSVKSNHHSTLQKSIESVLNEWLKPVKQSPVSEHRRN